MTNEDIRKMVGSIAPVVKAFVGEALSPLTARLDAIESRFAALPPPVTRDDASVMILSEVKTVRDAIPAVVADEVEKAVAAIPAAVDGAPGRDGRDGVPGDPGQDGQDGRDGKDADPDAVAAIVIERMTGEFAKVHEILEVLQEPAEPPELPDIPAMVQEAVAALPAPQDGRSVTPDELRPLIEETVLRAISAVPVPKDGEPGSPGKDGIGLAGGVINRDGELVLTLTDGRSQALGVIVGKDADPVEIERVIAEKVAAIPVPKDGLDGVGFDDMTEELAEDGRTIVHRYVRGEKVKEFRHTFAVLLDRGVYKEGETYTRGDAVTWGGSVFIAQETTTDKPETSKSWRLAVKRGRDGKDGKDGQLKGPPAPVKIGPAK